MNADWSEETRYAAEALNARGVVGGVYLHVPFCRADCAYCAFSREVPIDRLAVTDYLDALDREVDLWLEVTGRPLTPRTIYVGGGTPSFLDADEWQRLESGLSRLVDRSSVDEVTIEANPESLTDDTLDRFVAFGLTRLSLGAQSSHAPVLSFLGRTHGWDTVIEAMARARRRTGLWVSVDLIYGVPGLSAAGWDDTLSSVFDLAPDHLSAYCLSYEEGTSLTSRRGSGEFNDQTDDVQRAQYDRLVTRAESAGLRRYEVSNFGLEPAHCRHNLAYWRGGDYLGLGPSAHSSVGARRFWNHTRRDRWGEALRDGGGPVKGGEERNAERRRAESLMRLRLVEGVPRRGLPPRAHPFWTRASVLADEGLLVIEPERIRLSPDAFFLSDGVTSDLMAAWESDRAAG